MPSDAPHTEGGCLCGGVRYRITGAPARVGLCHCLECRKHHGAPFFAAAMFRHDQVSATGETRSYKGRHFCPNCGASVFGKDATEYEIHLGGLDQPDLFAPTYELWTIRRESWLPHIPGMTSYEKDAPDN